jgi:hypothetical protein
MTSTKLALVTAPTQGMGLRTDLLLFFPSVCVFAVSLALSMTMGV